MIGDELDEEGEVEEVLEEAYAPEVEDEEEGEVEEAKGKACEGERGEVPDPEEGLAGGMYSRE